jgi:hypothetical protein
MNCTTVDFAKDSIVYNITGCTREELENRLNLFFTSEKLLLKSDTPDQKVFQKGNKVMRILFGVFVKYFKIVVSVRQQDNLFSVRVLRDMNFILSGGLAGIRSSHKEFERITEAFKAYFNN